MLCLSCTTETSNPKFCSKSCSARYTNARKAQRSAESKKKTADSMRIHMQQRSTGYSTSECFSKIYNKPCGHCKKHRISRTQIPKYCDECKALYSDHGRVPFYFKFNVYHYPDLFDIASIDELGWWNNGARGEDSNMKGVSRDHIIPVSEAIKHGYDPYYISHMMNCSIVTHNNNLRKGTKSGMTYDELKARVAEFDGRPGEIRTHTK